MPDGSRQLSAAIQPEAEDKKSSIPAGWQKPCRFRKTLPTTAAGSRPWPFRVANPSFHRDIREQIVFFTFVTFSPRATSVLASKPDSRISGISSAALNAASPDLLDRTPLDPVSTATANGSPLTDDCLLRHIRESPRAWTAPVLWRFDPALPRRNRAGKSADKRFSILNLCSVLICYEHFTFQYSKTHSIISGVSSAPCWHHIRPRQIHQTRGLLARPLRTAAVSPHSGTPRRHYLATASRGETPTSSPPRSLRGHRSLLRAKGAATR